MAHNTQRKHKRVFTANAPGERVVRVECRDARTEAAFIVGRTRTLLARGARPRDIAILYRTTRTGTQLQAALAAAKLPFNCHNGNMWRSKPVRQ